MSRAREIGVLTTSRADFGIYLPVLRALHERDGLAPRIVAGGSHLSAEHGETQREILAAGFDIWATIPCAEGDMGASMARATEGSARVFREWQPDILLVLGDRFEMLAAALGAVPYRIPLAHIHGGEVTEGALDDSFRHALTKLSHLHFAVTAEAERRILQLGEEPWRVRRTGSPAVDRVGQMESVELDLPDRFLLVTYHPVTQEPGTESDQTRNLLAALDRTGLPAVITAPNADPGRAAIDRMVRAWTDDHDGSRFVHSAGPDQYVAMMRRATAMVGNSSSGIIEAPSLELPVVNIGTRQDGRPRPANVLDTGYETDAIAATIAEAVDPAFRRKLKGMESPYGDGRASQRIVDRLAEVPIDDNLLRKRFHDLPQQPS